MEGNDLRTRGELAGFFVTCRTLLAQLHEGLFEGGERRRIAVDVFLVDFVRHEDLQ